MINFFQEVQSLDKQACEAYHLTNELLMENAAHSLASFLRQFKNTHKRKPKLLIAAGAGDNGADGIALARILQEEFNIIIYLPFGTKSELCMKQFERANALGIEFSTDRFSQEIEVRDFMDSVEIISLRDWARDVDIVLDSLFGSGLNRPLDDETCEIIDWLNSLQGLKVSCDIPSGISYEGEVMWTAFRADHTCVMGACREAILGDRVKEFIGVIHICSLGISHKMYECLGVPSGALLEESDLRLPLRSYKNSNSHKGTFGHLGVLMGDKEGASIFAALSAYTFGAGLVSIIGGKSNRIPLEILHSETMPHHITAIAVGMGMGDFNIQEHPDIKNALLQQPVLLDADILYQDITKEILENNHNVVLTPHPKEFIALMKLLNIAECEVLDLQRDRFRFVRLFAQTYPLATLLLKGANPIIAKGFKLAVNNFGTPNLAKGGTGDVLSGLIASLLAQGVEPFEAAIQGSLAQTLAARQLKTTSYALSPLKLIDEVSLLQETFSNTNYSLF